MRVLLHCLSRVSLKSLKDWKSFIDNLKEVENKEVKFSNQSKFEKKIKTIDLHGASLTEANKKIIEFIYNAYDNGFKKLKIITGKGLRSKISKNPYISKDFGTLQNSVPEFLRKSEVKKVIHKIIPASIKDGGSGAFFIFLKKKID